MWRCLWGQPHRCVTDTICRALGCNTLSSSLFSQVRVNAGNRDGMTALMYAVSASMAETATADGKKSAVELLLTAGASVSECLPHTAGTPTDDAIAQVTSVTSRGETPLHLAAAAGRAQAVTLLLAAGADWTARDKAGRTPAMAASTATGEAGAAALKVTCARARIVIPSDRRRTCQVFVPKFYSSLARDNAGYTCVLLVRARGTYTVAHCADTADRLRCTAAPWPFASSSRMTLIGVHAASRLPQPVR